MFPTGLFHNISDNLLQASSLQVLGDLNSNHDSGDVGKTCINKLKSE